MKHLKIYFAILFFIFLGGANVELMAQLSAYSNMFEVTPYKLCFSTDINSHNIVSRNHSYVCYLSEKGIMLHKILNGKIEDNPYWSVDLQGKAGCFQVLGDGNFVAYNGKEIVWQTGTAGRGGKKTHLQIQNDGNLVLYNGTWSGGDGDALWASGTCDGVVNGCGSEGVR